MSNYVLVLDDGRRPLSPTSPARARQLLRDGKAAVFRRYPFTIILKRKVPDAEPAPVEVKIDPGSKVTGLALVQGDKVIWGGELTHRGHQIRDRLQMRRERRRGRRNKLRYRKPRYRTKAQINNAGRKREKGWLAPSLMHRVETIMTWMDRFCRYAPAASIAMELVRFDLQQMQNPEISGVEYQQGDLAGYEVKEYLLAKWGRKCAYCGAEGRPLEVEHIQPRSRGGSNRVSNLTLACEPCNQKKGNRPVEDFLSGRPDLLARIRKQAKQPLRDAASVNSTRWVLINALKLTGLPVTTGTGGRTKYNRKRMGWPKAHWLDAAAVGRVDALTLRTDKPLLISAKGQGGRQKGVFDKHGQPRRNKAGAAQIRPLKPIHGWRSGDIAKARGLEGRISPRTKGNFELRAAGRKPCSFPLRDFAAIHRNDGYAYQ
ncbi:RNA-guided endonuclease IscB [Salipiger mucosus]|uniref:RNA-guided endonuclease IscB n=1 Tax=Salipiger mucosus TaxID=263378 RepID=UPI000566CB15|nr:RNA-guided endonuclease IscB [Salipiger mucosus]